MMPSRLTTLDAGLAFYVKGYRGREAGGNLAVQHMWLLSISSATAAVVAATAAATVAVRILA